MGGGPGTPRRAGLTPTTSLGVGSRAPLSPRSWRRGPHGPGVGVLRAEHGVRDQRPRGRRGACRGLGFTCPHRRVGGELRPPVAVGAESHPRPRPKPRVIFNQRRPPSYHPGTRRGAGLPAAPGSQAATEPTLRTAGAQSHAERGETRKCASTVLIGPWRTRAWGGAPEISRHLAVV